MSGLAFELPAETRNSIRQAVNDGSHYAYAFGYLSGAMKNARIWGDDLPQMAIAFTAELDAALNATRNIDLCDVRRTATGVVA